MKSNKIADSRKRQYPDSNVELAEISEGGVEEHECKIPTGTGTASDTETTNGQTGVARGSISTSRGRVRINLCIYYQKH